MSEKTLLAPKERGAALLVGDGAPLELVFVEEEEVLEGDVPLVVFVAEALDGELEVGAGAAENPESDHREE